MEIERVSVVGAGTMGHGIAQVAAMGGFHTVLYDVDDRVLDNAVERIRDNLDTGIDKDKVTPEERDATLERLRTTGDLAEAAADADLVIEAVPEQIELKVDLFSRLEEHLPEDCVLATNTSSLSVAALAEGREAPERFLGMHFFNPVHIMELLEIVVHGGTSDQTVAVAREVGERMGKTPIVVKDSPGFATSRLGVLLGLEAMRMVEQGVASPADIDLAMELGYRHPMGPLRLSDLVGLDVRLGIAEYLHRELGSDAYEPPEILRRKVQEGKLGKKTGHGFYEW